MKFIELTSASNPVIKRAQRLLKKPRFCKESGTTLAEGVHLATELLHHPQRIISVFIRADALEQAEIQNFLVSLEELRLLQEREKAAERKDASLSADNESEQDGSRDGTLERDALDIPVYLVAPGLFASISPVEHPVGVICEIRIPQEDSEILEGDWVFLDGVQDPGNVGTILRLSLAAGVSNIALSSECAYLWSPKVLRAGMGAHFNCRFLTGASLSVLKEASGNECLVADARGGKNIYAQDWGRRSTIWVFGNEGRGVSETVLKSADLALIIPIDSRVESLNVASAASVCLFEQRRRRLLKP